MRTLRGTLASVMLVVGLTSAPGAFACSCSLEGSVINMATSDASFVGIAVERDDAGSPSLVRWVFDVDAGLRGRVADPEEVWSSPDGASCGSEFDLGRRYIVHARRLDDGRLWTGLCRGNMPLP